MNRLRQKPTVRTVVVRGRQLVGGLRRRITVVIMGTDMFMTMPAMVVVVVVVAMFVVVPDVAR